MAWLEYELAYYDSADQRFKHYTTKKPDQTTFKEAGYFISLIRWP